MEVALEYYRGSFLALRKFPPKELSVLGKGEDDILIPAEFHFLHLQGKEVWDNGEEQGLGARKAAKIRFQPNMHKLCDLVVI